MIDAEQAWQRILAHVRPGASERRAFLAALHHYLAASVLADRDIPACDRAAMDGYAVRAADLASIPAVLKRVGEIPAGSAAEPPIATDECWRILSGAAVPAHRDTVVMQEDTEFADADGGQVRFLHHVEMGHHISPRG